MSDRVYEQDGMLIFESDLPHPKQEIILSYVSDLVSFFMYYDRKEDEDLTVEDMKQLIEKDVRAIVSKFEEEMYKATGIEKREIELVRYECIPEELKEQFKYKSKGEE